ncbi:MAG: hypothetical protein ACYTF3_08180 [Planctomycetota bacterium]|jgi:hypothetical protein
MKTILTIGLLLAGFTSATAQEKDSRWFTDFDKAAKVAAEQGKDLLVDFTGSDW